MPDISQLKYLTCALPSVFKVLAVQFWTPMIGCGQAMQPGSDEHIDLQAPLLPFFAVIPEGNLLTSKQKPSLCKTPLWATIRPPGGQ
jgi:hypothetical protein